MTEEPTPPADADVIVVGTGPAGLGLANHLGAAGVRVLILEALPSLIDYPRGVGIDDESLRSIQGMGLVDRVLPCTTPQHIMRIVNGRGRRIVEMAPKTKVFGWSRRNAFIQPEVDRVLFEGLARFPEVDVRFGHRAERIEDVAGGVVVHVETDEGPASFRARYLVGADGGKSMVRKHMGVSFDGQSPSTRWLVADVRNDPVGTPNVFIGGDPQRPYVSLALPQAVRRFEFMLFDHEPDEAVEDDAFVDRLLRPHVPDPRRVDFIRKRVYTHHSRIAGTFRRGNVFIIGDAAHLMPVWQGQGWNSGQRDAANLAWKLAAVIAGTCDDALLDTYTQERHAHAKAMIDLSTAFGRIIKPTNRAVVAARDVAAAALNVVPSVKEYFAQMKYKPMPRYERGAVVDATDFRPAASSSRLVPALVAQLSANTIDSPVGTMFVQPEIVHDGERGLFDDVIGADWAVVQWGGNPEDLFDAERREALRRLGAKLVSVRPLVQCGLDLPADPDALVVGDADGSFKRWFDDRPFPVVVLRPDRFVAAACLTQDAGRAVDAVLRAAHVATPAAEPRTDRPDPALPAVA